MREKQRFEKVAELIKEREKVLLSVSRDSASAIRQRNSSGGGKIGKQMMGMESDELEIIYLEEETADRQKDIDWISKY